MSCFSVYCGLRMYHSLIQRRISFLVFTHRAKRLATHAASVSRNVFTRKSWKKNKILHNNTESTREKHTVQC